jgi:hypothetical protein
VRGADAFFRKFFFEAEWAFFSPKKHAYLSDYQCLISEKHILRHVIYGYNLAEDMCKGIRNFDSTN